jgi:hypothetical protein
MFPMLVRDVLLTLAALLVEQLLMFVIAYALILAITYVVDSRDKMARQVTETARLNTETARLNEELSRAQLAVLRGQMDPHFIDSGSHQRLRHLCQPVARSCARLLRPTVEA